MRFSTGICRHINLYPCQSIRQCRLIQPIDTMPQYIQSNCPIHGTRIQKHIIEFMRQLSRQRTLTATRVTIYGNHNLFHAAKISRCPFKSSSKATDKPSDLPHIFFGMGKCQRECLLWQLTFKYACKLHERKQKLRRACIQYCSMKEVSFEELFGGKICADLDRQHPRDLFDILSSFLNNKA